MTSQCKEKDDLIFTKTKIHDDFSKLSMVIFGFPKTGKTTFASNIKHDGKEPLFITTELGHNAIEVYAQSVVDVNKEATGSDHWSKFLKIRDYILDNKEAMQNKFSCIVFDLISDLDDFCAEYICKKKHVKTLKDLEWGEGYALHEQEFRGAIAPLFSVLPLKFIAHAQEKDIVYNGEKIKAQAPTLAKKTFNWINGKVDMLGFIVPATTKKEHPSISFVPNKGAIAGCRYSWMIKDFVLNYEDMQGSYNNIAKHFKGGKV